MPRYFFDTDDGERSLRDEEGSEFPSARDAHDAAVRLLPDIARDALRDGKGTRFAATVRDERGQPIVRVTLSLRTEWLAASSASEQIGQARRRVGGGEEATVLAERPDDEVRKH